MGALGFGPLEATGERLRFLTYDFEWYPHSMKIRLCGCFDGRQYRSYTSVSDFLDGELTSANRGAVFFAHAGGLSDVQFVFEEILKRRDPTLNVDVSFSGSSAVIVRLRQGKNAWTFADSFWILRASLREIGKLVGMAKGGAEESQSVFYAPLETLREYNALDCRILYRALRDFETETLAMGGALRLTIASCAMYLFRAAFLKRTIPTHDRANVVARRAYVASRVEVFATHCGPARVYDINSSFPKSMTKPLPGRMLCANRRLEVPRVGGKPLYPGEPCYLAELTVTVPDVYLPPLPSRAGERVFFPVGTWRGWFMSPDVECLHRVKGARVEQVHEVIHFEPFSDMAEYVSVLYEKKARAAKAGNKFEEATAKFYLNTLYGKTAESRLKESLVIGKRGGLCIHDPPCPLDAAGRLPCVRMIRPGVFLRAEEVPVVHEWVPIAAHVTANSRLMLFDWFTMARRPRYGDTDSIVMPKEEGSLPTGTALGELKLDKEIDGGVFLAPKLYRFNSPTPTEAAIVKRAADKGESHEDAREALSAPIIRAKGFRRLSPAEFEALASGDPVVVGRMLRVKETLAGESASPRERVYWKALRLSTRPKRAPDGDTETRPWTVAELGEKWIPPARRVFENVPPEAPGVGLGADLEEATEIKR